MTATQELARACLGGIEGADPELVAEETLCLVATATARAVEVGAGERSAELAGVIEALLALPYTYREYLVGGAMIAQEDPGLADANRVVEGRLGRKESFYNVHLPQGQFPGQRALDEKMALWMGRISPPSLPELPTERLTRLELVPVLLTHLRLVLAYVRKEVGTPRPGAER